MAVAARPGPSDARVPCPLCGGLIHPIAGKCKHCKADLTAHRAARPAANGALPPLAPTAGHANGHAVTGAAAAAGHGPIGAVVSGAPVVPVGHAGAVGHVGPVGLMVAAAREAAQPVLPPHPGAAVYAVPLRPSAWRSWPIVVIVVAVLAIVAAVVLMAWPASRSTRDDGKRALRPPPAPERMPTAPELNSSHPVPQIAPPPHQPAPPEPGAPADPRPQAPESPSLHDPSAGADPPVDPAAGPPGDPADDPSSADGSEHDRAPSDPFAGVDPRTRTVMFAVLSHLCRRVNQCSSDDDFSRIACSRIRHPAVPPLPHCPAAARCLSRIDTMACGSPLISVAQLAQVLQQLDDCAEALRC